MLCVLDKSPGWRSTLTLCFARISLLQLFKLSAERAARWTEHPSAGQRERSCAANSFGGAGNQSGLSLQLKIEEPLLITTSPLRTVYNWASCVIQAASAKVCRTAE